MSAEFMYSDEYGLPNFKKREELDAKKARAEKITNLHVAGAFAVGFTPIPFSDSPILIANQALLVNKILSIYGREELKELLSVLLGQFGISLAISRVAVRSAAYLAAQLLKLLPGLGSLAGGLINGAVAGAITYSYGAAISSFCYYRCKKPGGMDSSVTALDIQDFTQVFRQTFDDYSSMGCKTENISSNMY